MKVLIVYATRTGTTERAARMLAGHFPGAHLCDLREKSPDPSDYDIILFGSGIYFGRILRPLRNWLNEYWEVIRPKIKGVFICNALIDEVPELMRSNFSLELRNASVVVDSFGGEYSPKNLNAYERTRLKLTHKALLEGRVTELVPCILPDRVKAFADEIYDYLEIKGLKYE